MTTQLPDIVARVRIDTDSLKGSVRDAAAKGSAIGSALGSAVGNLAGGGLSAAAGKLADFAKGSVDAFAAVEDATGAASVEFGKQLPQVVQFAKGAASAYGLSQRAALDAQNTFGTFGKAAGLTGTDLSGFSQKLTGLAGDLASFKGTSTQQAIDAVGAALRGESEPIRAYGVLLDDASLKATAMSIGLIKASKNSDQIAAAQVRAKLALAAYNDAVKKHGEDSTEAQKAQVGLTSAQNALKKATEGTVKPLTSAQKVLAAQAAIFAQTKDAQGDYQRTSKSTANVQKTLQAATENAQAALGAKLAPTLTFLRELLLKAIQAATGLFDVFNTIAGVVATVGSALGAVAGFVKDNAVAFGILTAGLIAANAQFIALTIKTNAQVAAFIIQQTVTKAATVVTEGFAAAQAALNAVLDANPIGIVILAVAALVAGVILAYKHSETFRRIVSAAFDAIKTAASAVAKFFTDTLLPVIIGVFNGIKSAVGAVVGFFRDHWKLILGILTGPFGLAVTFIATHFDQIIGFVKGMPRRIASAASGLWDGIKDSFRSAVNWIIRKWNDLHFTIGGGSVFGHKLPSVTLNTPDIPQLATGGTLLSAGRVLVGERGPEYLDLPKNARVTPLDKAGATYNVTFNTNQVQPEAVVRALRNAAWVMAG
jgi:hypothetical protein